MSTTVLPHVRPASRARGIAFAAVALCCCTVAVAKPATKVQLWFDTEDYTSDRSNDAIRDIANLLTEEGVRGHFNIVGHLAKFILDNRRYDVIDALRPHLVGTQTLYHSLHPNLTEATDLADYDAAYHIALAQEAEGFGMLKAVFGRERILFSCYPGNGSSYVGFDVYADLGVPFHGGTGAFSKCDEATMKRGEFWYLNQRHILYNCPQLHLETFLPGRWEKFAPRYDRVIDSLATYGLVTLYMHPHMAVRMEHWDAKNYGGGNNVPFGKWIPPTPRPAADTALYYARLRAFVRRLKADPRFAFCDCEQFLAAQKPRAAITRADLPAIRAALLANFGAIETPHSWCVADVFCAVVKFLRGETRHEPGNVHGFLEAPFAVSAPVTLRTDDLAAAAARIDLRRYLPARITVGSVTVGPADFLFAALDALTSGRDTVTVTPRNPLGDLAQKLPSLATFTHTNTWIYWPKFKDEYLADRLRWQYWTFRYE